MTQRQEYRRPNGKRLEGAGLGHRLASEVRGMVLAQAFVAVRAAGCDLRVSKLDGAPRLGYPADARRDRINVAVVGGIVQQAWLG